MKKSKKNFIPFNLFVIFSILILLGINFLARPGSYHPDIPVRIVILNTIYLAVPTLLIFGILMVGFSLIKRKFMINQVDPSTLRFLFYTSRIGGIVQLLWLTIFFLVVFLDDRNIWDGKSGFYVREIPQLILAILMIPAWKWSLVGFIVFGIAGVYYARIAFMSHIAMIQTFLIWSAPLLVVSFMFFIHWRLQKNLFGSQSEN